MQAPCFGRTSRLLVPIYGNSADEQNGPPMNADKRRWNEKLCLSAFIRVHPRSSAAKYRPSEFSSRTANRWSTPRAQFPERDVSSSLWITPQPMFKAPQRMKRFWLCESTVRVSQVLTLSFLSVPLWGGRCCPAARREKISLRPLSARLRQQALCGLRHLRALHFDLVFLLCVSASQR